jgi:aminopeptidase N
VRGLRLRGPFLRGILFPLGLLASTLLAGGCSLLRPPPPPEPEPPPWDTLSPPPLVEEAEWTAPDPIPMGLPPAPGRYTDEIDVLHYDVELVIPLENDRISSRTVIRYLRPEQRGAHALTLDFTGLAVEAVTALGIPVPYTFEDGIIRVDHPGRPGIFDTIQVEIMARGTPSDGLILRDNVHGAPSAFGDNWPNRARFWFPSVDHPSDKATVSFTVHAPEGRQVVANGIQEGSPVPADPDRAGGLEGLWSWRWVNTVPIPTYLMVVGVAEMEVMEQGLAACGQAPASPRDDGCIEITAWAFPADTAHARQVFRRSAEMVDLYVELVGPYPYEKLANVQSSTRFGGMENASAIFYSEQAIAQGRDIEGTVAHEIAHQWFGNSLTPADWAHLWLSEGFASYFGPLFWERTEGDLALRERLAGVRERYLASDVTDRPVVDEGAANLLDLLNANSYQKGALVLHMLRNVMGERTFFRGIREYYRRHSGGNVVTADFRQVMEEVHGDSLEWFFQQWLHRPGYPELQTQWSWNPATRQARVTLRQQQRPDWPTFRMPVEFEFVLDGGVHRTSVWVDGRDWTGTVTLPRAPVELRVDPEGWLLFRDAGVTRVGQEE